MAPGLAALFEMITGPAARAGLDLDEGLPARILEDTGTDPGALALLAFALHELYEARTADGRLTLAAYDAFGGVKGAHQPARRDDLRAPPGRTQGAACTTSSATWSQADERGVATRTARVRCASLRRVKPLELIDAFTDARLLVTDRGAAGEAVVEVAHEALFREWPRLRDWIGERADDLRLVRQAEAAAAEWRRAGSRREPSLAARAPGAGRTRRWRVSV